jgi:amidase
MLKFSDYCAYDATGLAELVRRGDVQPIELIDSAVDAIAALNPSLNAVSRVFRDLALDIVEASETDAPFRGVPLLLKDLGSSLSGIPTECGSRFFQGWTRNYDSEIVRRYKAAGFAILGKASTSELGTSGSSNTIASGTIKNPWDLTRTAGISSGGSAAAVAAGIVPIVHASDAAGSIRGPAAWCGLVGLKPTRGRISYAPDGGEYWCGMASHHVISRSVRDCAATLDCTAGFVLGDPHAAPSPARPFLEMMKQEPKPLRIGYTLQLPDGTPLKEEIKACIVATARLLEEMGHHVEASSPQWDIEPLQKAIDIVSMAALTESVQQRAKDTGQTPTEDMLERPNYWLFEQGKKLKAFDLLRATRALNTASRSFSRFFATFDIWLSPTMADTAPKLDFLDSSSADVELHYKRFYELYCFNPIYNASGLPAITLPLYSSADGLPIGIMFGAGFGREAILLSLAAQLETAQPWASRKPSRSSF